MADGPNLARFGRIRSMFVHVRQKWPTSGNKWSKTRNCCRTRVKFSPNWAKISDRVHYDFAPDIAAKL